MHTLLPLPQALESGLEALSLVAGPASWGLGLEASLPGMEFTAPELLSPPVLFSSLIPFMLDLTQALPLAVQALGPDSLMKPILYSDWLREHEPEAVSPFRPNPFEASQPSMPLPLFLNQETPQQGSMPPFVNPQESAPALDPVQALKPSFSGPGPSQALPSPNPSSPPNRDPSPRDPNSTPQSTPRFHTPWIWNAFDSENFWLKEEEEEKRKSSRAYHLLYTNFQNPSDTLSNIFSKTDLSLLLPQDSLLPPPEGVKPLLEGETPQAPIEEEFTSLSLRSLPS